MENPEEIEQKTLSPSTIFGTQRFQIAAQLDGIKVSNHRFISNTSYLQNVSCQSN